MAHQSVTFTFYMVFYPQYNPLCVKLFCRELLPSCASSWPASPCQSFPPWQPRATSNAEIFKLSEPGLLKNLEGIFQSGVIRYTLGQKCSEQAKFYSVKEGNPLLLMLFFPDAVKKSRFLLFYLHYKSETVNCSVTPL